MAIPDRRRGQVWPTRKAEAGTAREILRGSNNLEESAFAQPPSLLSGYPFWLRACPEP